ncbi:MAG: diguanylate cyclase [Actinophytocola sp.]|nr:diguanylate cyclase [Actinophytocola sp.]
MTTLGTVVALALAVALAVVLAAARQRGRDLRRRLAEADRTAHTDPLTGLANRAGLRRLIDELATPDAADHHVAAIALDLDGLKPINDHHGHHVGDEVLAEVARRITAVHARMFGAARLGGDEFVVLLDRYPDATTATRYADWLAGALRMSIGMPRVIDQPPITITASVGFAVMPIERIDELLTAADLAMYRRKSARTGIHSDPASSRQDPIPLPRHRRREPAGTDPSNRTRRDGYATTTSSNNTNNTNNVTVPARGMRPAEHRQRLVS